MILFFLSHVLGVLLTLFSHTRLNGVVLLLLATGIAVHEYQSQPLPLIGNTTDIIAPPKDIKPTPTDLAELASQISTSSESTPEVEEKENVLQIASGDTMMSALTKIGIKKEVATQAIEALRRVHDPRDLKVGQQINVRYRKNASGISLLALSFKAARDHEVNLEANAEGFSAKKHQVALQKTLKHVEGRVSASFYSSALKRGIPPQIIRDAINALAYDINWQHDPKSGDNFSFVYEVYQDPEGNEVRAGELKYVAFAPGGNIRRIYRFQPKKGVPGYYNEKGESVVKALLQTPLDVSKLRITSKFSSRRVHPILGYSRAHKGVDFGAATGTPVRAAGDGVVVKAGRWGQYGNYIMVKHNNEYSTAYAHLSRIQVKAGQKVSQRQVIGNVGSTGSSTGPHLHYEVIRNGVHVNPQSVKQVSTAKLTTTELAQFRQVKLQIEKEIAELAPSSQVASIGTPIRAS